MGTVELRARVPGLAAAELFARLRQVERYSEVSPAVLSLTVLERERDRQRAAWEVDFHGGVMRWVQEDVIVPHENAIRFRQVQGDIERFEGVWSVSRDGDGCIVTFQASFEVGLPGLEEVLEPLARDALLANVTSVLEGLSGHAVEVL